MADETFDALENILKGAEGMTPEQVQAALPAATNPGAHAPKSGNESSDEIIAKQVREVEAAKVPDAPEAPAVSSEQTETETHTEQAEEAVQPLTDKDALFAQLRRQFPNEPMTSTAARVEAAFSNEPEPAVESGPDPLLEIHDSYLSTIQEAEDAEAAVRELMGDGSEVVEYTPEIRAAEQRAMEARLAVKSAHSDLVTEANEAIEAQYPELNDSASLAIKLVHSKIKAAEKANPNFRASPTAIAEIGRDAAIEARQILASMPAPAAPQVSAQPTRQPAPAAPKPPVAGLSSGVQASHATAAAPAPGAQVATDDVSRIRNAESIDDLAAMFFGNGLKRTVLT